MKISLIIPLYYANLAQYRTIKKCFDSLEASNFQGELIVINDESPIDIEDFPVTLTHHRNFGYTKSVNDGLKLATGDILVIANQDIVFTPELVKQFEKINFGIYSPKTTDEGEGDKFGSIWGMSRKVYELLGGLDEQMSHFFSDGDYYRRAKETGVPVVKWRSIMIEHEGNNAYQFANKSDFYQTDMNAYNSKWGDVR